MNCLPRAKVAEDRLLVRCFIESLHNIPDSISSSSDEQLCVQVSWKGTEGRLRGIRKRTAERTGFGTWQGSDRMAWGSAQPCSHTCSFRHSKGDGRYHSWKVKLVILMASYRGVRVMGTAYLDLGELLAVARSHGSQQQFSLKVGCSNSEWAPILHGRVEFLESDGLPLMEGKAATQLMAPADGDSDSKGRRAARRSRPDGSKASRGTSSSSGSEKSDEDLLVTSFGATRFLSGWRSAFKRHKPQDRYGSRTSSSEFSDDLPSQVVPETDAHVSPGSEDDGAEGGHDACTEGTEELSPQSWSSSRWAAPSKRIKAWVGSLRETATVREAPLTTTTLATVPDALQDFTSGQVTGLSASSPVSSAMADGEEESVSCAEAASLVHEPEPPRGFSLQRWLSSCRALHQGKHGRSAEAAQEADDAKPIQSNGPDVGVTPSKERLAAELALPALRANEEPTKATPTAAEPYDEEKALKEALESSARIARGLSGRIESLNASGAGEDTRQEDAPGEEEELLGTGDLMDDGWYSKRVTSRGEASVSVSTAVDTFYAGLDQRSSGVGGEAACAPLAVMISRWLLRQRRLPTGPGEFDGIVKAGSQQWQQMCSKTANRSRFSDLHFDLETTLAAQRQKARVAVDADSSYVGFFRPSQTPCEALDDMLQGTKPLQSIWREIADTTKGTSTFIVGWNDHWFVIHVEEDGHCYLIDTLGEKLAEGCDCAFMLRFPPTAPSDDGVSSSDIDLPLHVMESVEACQQYLEAFYVSATLKQLEKDLAKCQAEHGDCFADVSIERVFRQLQIDFHRVSLRRVITGSPRRRSPNQRRARKLPGAWSTSADASSKVVSGVYNKQGDDEDMEMSGLVTP